jgi:hypothetical protein
MVYHLIFFFMKHSKISIAVPLLLTDNDEREFISSHIVSRLGRWQLDGNRCQSIFLNHNAIA